MSKNLYLMALIISLSCNCAPRFGETIVISGIEVSNIKKNGNSISAIVTQGAVSRVCYDINKPLSVFSGGVADDYGYDPYDYYINQNAVYILTPAIKTIDIYNVTGEHINSVGIPFHHDVLVVVGDNKYFTTRYTYVYAEHGAEPDYALFTADTMIASGDYPFKNSIKDKMLSFTYANYKDGIIRVEFSSIPSVFFINVVSGDIDIGDNNELFNMITATDGLLQHHIIRWVAIHGNIRYYLVELRERINIYTVVNEEPAFLGFTVGQKFEFRNSVVIDEESDGNMIVYYSDREKKAVVSCAVTIQNGGEK